MLGYCPVPATTEVLCQYAAMLARSLKYASVKQYLNIVRLLHLEWNLPNPLKDNFHLDRVLKGMRRDKGDAVSRKMPITPNLLRGILSMLNLNVVEDGIMWAAALVMFYAMLRKSNVLVESVDSFNPAKHLRREDITFQPWGIMVQIRWSKTNQFQSRVLEIPLPRLSGTVLCPAQAVYLAYQMTKEAPPAGPAFVVIKGGRFIPLPSRVFIARVRKILQKLGVDQKAYAGHSFRRGGASWAYHVDIPVDTIRQIGDWKSNAYQRYICENKDSLLKAVSIMVGKAAEME